ncbi:hypothetical protein N0V90_008808 [Kalmusia sp. IMI 367209]|nr:hypothetical protein N0V90_008808 [Kalmusia sp. IMI 367209]
MPTEGRASRPPDFPNATWTEVTTGPYAVVGTNTFYSGNVYLSIASIEAHFPCRSTHTRYNSILTLASSDVQTMRGYPINNIPWSLNYADFNEPVPYSAWYGEPECNLQVVPCSVVFPGEYRPQIVMPAAIRQFDPAWSDCSLGFFGLNDPPIALKSAGNFLSSSSSVPAVPVTTPNDPSDPSSTPATPADPPTPPTQTPTVQPPTPSNDPPSDPSDPDDPSDPNDPDDPPNPPNSPPNNPPSNPTGPNSPPNNPGSTPNNGQPGATSRPNNPPGNTNPGPGPITITDAPGGPIVADPTGGVIINPGTTLQPGDPPVTISGTTISAAPTGIVIIDPTGTRTIPFPTTPGGVTITAGSSTLVADPSGIVVAPGTTLRPGDPAVVISGTTFSAAPTGIVIIGPSGTQTIPFPTGSGATTLTIGGSTLVADPSGIVIAPGTTLHPGDSPVTIDGTTISFGPSGIVVVGPDGVTSTVALPTGSGEGSQLLTITLGNGDVVTATSSNGQVVIDGVTLSPENPVATLPNGQIVSLGPSGVVIGTGTGVSTAVFADPTTTGTGSPGGFPGAASSVGLRWENFAAGVMLVIVMLVM